MISFSSKAGVSEGPMALDGAEVNPHSTSNGRRLPMRRGTAFLLLALALSSCTRHPTYGRPAPRDSTPIDDPPPTNEAPLPDEPTKR
jgi:hypothetical protein